jgi:hypothetical protein
MEATNTIAAIVAESLQRDILRELKGKKGACLSEVESLPDRPRIASKIRGLIASTAQNALDLANRESLLLMKISSGRCQRRIDLAA